MDKRQGIKQISTMHVGSTATLTERRGSATERGNMNREITVKGYGAVICL